MLEVVEHALPAVEVVCQGGDVLWVHELVLVGFVLRLLPDQVLLLYAVCRSLSPLLFVFK